MRERHTHFKSLTHTQTDRIHIENSEIAEERDNQASAEDRMKRRRRSKTEDRGSRLYLRKKRLRHRKRGIISLFLPTVYTNSIT